MRWWRDVSVCVLAIFALVASALPCDSNPCPDNAPCVQVGSDAYTCQTHCNQSVSNPMWSGGRVSSSDPSIYLFKVDQVTHLLAGPMINVTGTFSPNTVALTDQWRACRSTNNVAIVADSVANVASRFDLASARLLNTWVIPSGWADIACSVDNTRLFLVNGSVFNVFNTTSGELMRSSIPTSTDLSRVVVVKNMLWVMDSAYGVLAYNISNNETLVATILLQSFSGVVAFSGKMTADDQGLFLYVGFIKATVAQNGVFKLNISDNYANVGTWVWSPSGTAGTEVWPVIDPLDPTIGLFESGCGASSCGNHVWRVNLTTMTSVQNTAFNSRGYDFILDPLQPYMYAGTTFGVRNRYAFASSTFTLPGSTPTKLHFFSTVGTYTACTNNGTCSSDTCVCPTGFQGTSCELSPCRNATLCLNGGTCLASSLYSAGFQCQCASGWAGVHCDSVLGACTSQPCQNGGTCTPAFDNGGNWTCTCPVGYSGTACQTNIDDCASQPCQNGGTCVDGSASFSCVCPAIYKGTRCQDVNPCGSNPCPSNAPCTQIGVTYTCQTHCSRVNAHSMWMGGIVGSTPRIFQVDQDSDLTTGVVIDVPSFGTASGQWAACRARNSMIIMASPSSASAVLVNLTTAQVVKTWSITAFSDIACSASYDRLFVANSTTFDVYSTTSGLRLRTSVPTTYPITQLLVSERWPNRLWLADSGSNVYVYNTTVNETFVLQIQPTTYRSSTTFDGYIAMDELGQNLYLGYASASPAPGVLKLNVSGDMYALVGDLNVVGLPGSQTNTFRPVVDPFDQAGLGFFWASGGTGGFRLIVNLTTLEVVQASFATNNNIGVGNYVLEPFGFRVFDTLTFDTYDRGSSTVPFLPYNPPGLSSKRMHLFAQIGTYSPCANNGTCSNDVCACPGGFTGQSCELSPCSLNATLCTNGGTCLAAPSAVGNGFVCQCVPGFTGTLCEHDVQVCLSMPCQNGGSCTTDLTNVQNWSCTCPAGYSGAACQTNIDECASQPCQNGATCVDGINSFTCTCPSGIQGTLCINECASLPCQNGGTCVDGIANYTCTCPSAWIGKQCQTDNPCLPNPCISSAPCVLSGDAGLTSCLYHCNQTKVQEVWIGSVSGSSPTLKLVDQQTFRVLGPSIDLTSTGLTLSTTRTIGTCPTSAAGIAILFELSDPGIHKLVRVNLATQQVLSSLSTSVSSAVSYRIACVSDDNRYVTVGENNNVRTYDMVTGLVTTTVSLTPTPASAISSVTTAPTAAPGIAWVNTANEIYVIDTGISGGQTLRMTASQFPDVLSFGEGSRFMAIDPTATWLYVPFKSISTAGYGYMRLAVTDSYSVDSSWLGGIPSPVGSGVSQAYLNPDGVTGSFLPINSAGTAIDMYLPLMIPSAAVSVGAAYEYTPDWQLNPYIYSGSGGRVYRYDVDQLVGTFSVPNPTVVFLRSISGATWDPCSSTYQGVCTNDVCRCPPGFDGAQCQFSPCDLLAPACYNSGICTPEPNVNTTGFSCSCSYPFYGPRCEFVVACASSPCRNGGTCTGAGASQFQCLCVSGYSGAVCQTEINECASQPCANGGTCMDHVNSFTCACPGTFGGTRCQTDMQSCISHPCQNGGTCNGTALAWTCTCPPGYSGTACQTDINECASQPCQSGGTCTDLSNGFNCTCPVGIYGTLCENECASQPCQNGGSCIDGIGSFTCACATGYQGVTCFNECGSQPCLHGATCIDGNEFFSCVCKAGYTGTLCETDVNDCASAPCQNGGTCIDGVASYTCSCVLGYTGRLCQTRIDNCASQPCQHNGTCFNGDIAYACNCTGTGYNGTHCEFEVNECATANGGCLGGRTCTNSNGSYACSDCAVGTFGVASGGSCLNCPAGRYNNVTGSSTCVACDVGTFQNTPGATRCSACSTNEFSRITGSDSCFRCSSGMYSSSVGATTCTSCPTGRRGFNCTLLVNVPLVPSGSTHTGGGSSSSTGAAAPAVSPAGPITALLSASDPASIVLLISASVAAVIASLVTAVAIASILPASAAAAAATTATLDMMPVLQLSEKP
jgi:hypothetical protein